MFQIRLLTVVIMKKGAVVTAPKQLFLMFRKHLICRYIKKINIFPQKSQLFAYFFVYKVEFVICT